MLKICSLLAFSCLLTSVASATTMKYTFDSGAVFKESAGSVTVSDIGTNQVQVSVSLSTDFSFRQAPDSQHTGLTFDLSGITSPLLYTFVSDGPGVQTFQFQSGSSYNNTPYGSFPYSVICTTCSKGTPTTPTQTLVFDLSATGLSTSSFLSNGQAVFAVDLIGLNNTSGTSTGAVGANTGVLVSPPAVMPEPSSLLLLGTGLAAASIPLRRRLTSR